MHAYAVPEVDLRAPRAGTGELAAVAGGAGSVLSRARAHSPLRFLCPRVDGARAAWACVATLGGGLLDGDRLGLDVDVASGAALCVTTQASTKVFRGASSQRTAARVDGTLLLLSDPVACFAGARHSVLTEIALGEGAGLVVVDGFTSGRAAYGERWAFDRLTTRVRVTRAGRPLVDDALTLDAAHAYAGELRRVDAIVTVMALGSASALLAADLLAPAAPSAELVVAPSALACGGALARIAAARPQTALAEARRRLRNLREILGRDSALTRW
jgi:urease accessory protein